MKNISILLCILVVTVQFPMAQISTNDSVGIRFESETIPLDSLKAKAKREKKPILIDTYTPGCYWCKWMEKNVFINDTVADFYNSHFINVRKNIADSTTDGAMIGKMYELRCVPIFLFIDGNGNLLDLKSGAHDVKRFIEAGEKVLHPTEPLYGTLDMQYHAGTIMPDQFVRYIFTRNAACLSVMEQFDWFRSSLTNGALYKGYPKDSLCLATEKVYGMFMNFCLHQRPAADTIRYKQLRQEIVQLRMPCSEKLLLKYDCEFYRITKNWDDYATTAIAYVEKYVPDSNYFELNDFAWYFYENVEDTAHLNIALGWVRKSLRTEPVYFNTDTYAALLYKLGRYDDAYDWIGTALQLAKHEGAEEPPPATLKLQKKIEVMLGIQ